MSSEDREVVDSATQREVGENVFKAAGLPTASSAGMDDEEDASHKRKFKNDDEVRGDESPARKKLSIKTELQSNQNKIEEDKAKSETSESEMPPRGVSKFGLEALGGTGGDHPIHDTIECPSGLIGRLIGKQGETIKYLQGETNTKLQIDHQAQGNVKKVGISGPSLDAVRRVKTLIQEVLDSEMAPVAPGETMETLDCPQGIVGRVIGRKGETIKALQSASGAKIIVEQNFPEGVPRKVKISGKPDTVQLAVKMVTELISGEPGSAINVINKYTTHATASRVVECPKSMVGRVIGKGGETIKQIQANTGAVVQIQQDSDPCYITVSGNHPAVETASAIIEDISRGGTPIRPSSGNSYGMLRPSMADYSPYPHPYSPMAPQMGGYGAYMANYPPHSPTGYPYYPSMPIGGYPPSMHPAGPPPAQHGYTGYPGYATQPGAPYGPPPVFGNGGYSQGMGGPEAYPQPPIGSIERSASVVSNSWTELHDVEGRLYYHNTQTGASQWEKPADFQ